MHFDGFERQMMLVLDYVGMHMGPRYGLRIDAVASQILMGASWELRC